MDISNKLLTIAENTPNVSETLKAAQTEVSGETITVTDVCSTEHIVPVKVSSKNMFNPEKLLNASGWTVTDGVYSGKSRPLYNLYLYDAADDTGTPILTGFEVGKRYAIKYFGRADLGEGERDGGGITFRFVYDDGTTSGVSEAMITSTTETEISHWSTSGKNVVGLHVHYWHNVQNYIRDIQVTEVTTAIPPYTPHIPDLSTVDVKTAGKNLVDVGYKTAMATGYETGGLKYTVNEDNSITINGTAQWELYPSIAYYKQEAGKTYTLSGTPNGSRGTYHLYTTYRRANENTTLYPDTANGKITFKAGQNRYTAVILKVLKGVVMDNVTIYPQIEVGNTATEYEKYCGATYIPTADGTIEGINSISPEMNIFTNKVGVLIDARYFSEENSDKCEKLALLKDAEQKVKDLI